MPHLSNFLILFTFEQKNSCLTKFFMQKITSEIFSSVNSTLSRDGERKGLHPSLLHCDLKLKHSKLVNSSIFFVSEYGLTTLQIRVVRCIIQNCSKYIVFARSCVQDLFLNFALSANMENLYSAPLKRISGMPTWLFVWLPQLKIHFTGLD